jgi:glucose-1-phosphate thymidylyltransferase
MEGGRLDVTVMGRGFAWLDTGTPENLTDAAEFVRVLEKRQGFKIACPEEVAYRAGFIDEDGLKRCAERVSKSAYGRYLFSLLEARPHPAVGQPHSASEEHRGDHNARWREATPFSSSGF